MPGKYRDFDIDQTLLRVPLFASLEKHLVAVLADHARCRTYKENEILIDENGPAAPGLFVLVSGEVVIQRMVKDQPVILARRGPGEILGELSLLDERQPSATVVASTSANCLMIERKVFLKCLAQSFDLSMALLQNLAGRLREADEARVSSITLNAPGRLAEYILHWLSEHDYPPLFVIDKKQAFLGADLSLSRESINKALERLQKLEPPALIPMEESKRAFQYNLEALQKIAVVSGS